MFASTVSHIGLQYLYIITACLSIASSFPVSRRWTFHLTLGDMLDANTSTIDQFYFDGNCDEDIVVGTNLSWFS